MSQFGVNVIDPVTPAAAGAVQQTASNINQSANRRLQYLQLKTQEELEEKRIKATAEEHAKYQDFLKRQQEDLFAAQERQEQHRFEHESALNQQKAATDQKMVDKANSLQLRLKEIDAMGDLADAKAQESLLKEREAVARELANVRSSLAAAQLVHEKSKEELEAAVEMMSSSTTSLIQGLDSREKQMNEVAALAATRLARALATNPQLAKEAGTIFNTVYGATERARKRANIFGELVDATTEEYSAQVGLSPTQRENFKEFLTNALSYSDQESVGNPELQKTYIERMKDLYSRILEEDKDPLTRGAEIKYLMRAFPAVLRGAKDAARTEGQKHTMQAASEWFSGKNEILGRYWDAVARRLNTVGNPEAAWKAAGLEAVDRQELALALAKVQSFIAKGHTVGELDPTVLAGLDPATRRHLERWLGKVAPSEETIKGYKGSLAEMESLSKKEGSLLNMLDIKEKGVAAEGRRKKAETERYLLEKLRKDTTQ
jgi:alkylhydroperoxidase/carboxymuconolactone decarboxylase family protein YurZ